MEQTSVQFFRENEKWGELSNFYRPHRPLVFEENTYSTSEHLFQAFKFISIENPLNLEYGSIIRNAATPYQAKMLAGQKKVPLHQDRSNINATIEKYYGKGVRINENWDNIRDNVMRHVLGIKFDTDEACKKVLMSTGSLDIQEKSPYDGYWGIGRDGKGKNLLGKLLMELRTRYQKDSFSPSEKPVSIKRKRSDESIVCSDKE